jgi:hypothetical protein
MRGHECYHCKQWVEEGEPHDCWTTTESALTRELPEDLQDAYERLRETAADFGDQRIYASHHCIMFARKACYFFVRPKRKALELVIFLGRTVRASQIRRATPSSKTKIAHVVYVTHRDEVEPPITDWLAEAYESSDALSTRSKSVRNPPKRPTARRPQRYARRRPAASARRSR